MNATFFPYTKSQIILPSIARLSRFIIFLTVLMSSAGMCFAETTTWVSKDSDSMEGNGTNYYPSISSDGRYVAFQSDSDNLVSNDTNGWEDIFVHDRDTGETVRVNLDSDGNQANSQTLNPSISADGRYVAFWSLADNLVAGDINGWEAFIHDRETGETRRVCVNSDGEQCNGGSGTPSLSANGRYLSFCSSSNNLVADDTNMMFDTFVHDLETGDTTRVSVDSNGNQTSGGGCRTSISEDGRFVVFQSHADDLVPDDTNGVDDIFVHDRQSGETSRVSINSNGEEANQACEIYFTTSISADGRYVAFVSKADNLVPHDTNGVEDVFVHDREVATTTRVSVDSLGNQANAFSDLQAPISASGRYVAFASAADNLISDDSNDRMDVFLHDLNTSETVRISISSDETEADGSSWSPAFSFDGQYVAFASFATNLVSEETSNYFGWEIYVRGPLAKEEELNIDILPSHDPNRINPERGIISVAILSEEALGIDDIDLNTVEFGPAGAIALRHFIRDLDQDGDLDLIYHFEALDTGIACGDTNACLNAETLDQIPVKGCDTIITVGCRTEL